MKARCAPMDAVEKQRRYYAETAPEYDRMHGGNDGEHGLALGFLRAMLDHYNWNSVLDVGSGTGRTVKDLLSSRPGVNVIGVEPVAALREVGHRSGLPKMSLIDGDATSLDFSDGSFDCVSAFGILHHIEQPQKALREMARVSSRAVFVSDSNRFAQGGLLARATKRLLATTGIWRPLNWLRNGGKHHRFSPEDGVFYSYSLFDNERFFREQFARVHVATLTGIGMNPLDGSDHLAICGIKHG